MSTFVKIITRARVGERQSTDLSSMIRAACEHACFRRSFSQVDRDDQALRALPVLLENSTSMKSAVAAEWFAIIPSFTLRIVFATRSYFLISASESSRMQICEIFVSRALAS